MNPFSTNGSHNIRIFISVTLPNQRYDFSLRPKQKPFGFSVMCKQKDVDFNVLAGQTDAKPCRNATCTPAPDIKCVRKAGIEGEVKKEGGC
jgi:hypothetical protein